MKAYVGFSDADVDALTGLRIAIGPHLPAIIEEFYAALRKNPQTHDVLVRSGVPVESLRGTFQSWIEGLFEGRYDTAYLHRRARIGQAHVRVGLPQHYMFTGMAVFRIALTYRIRHLAMPAMDAQLGAIHKLLDLELAVMNDSYREDLVTRVRELERTRYEERLSESEHLATIGRLAATLAHEIKNPLAGISGAIQVFGAELDDNHPHKEVITEVMRQIDRLDAAVRDLLVFARPKPPVRRVQNLSEVVERALLLLRREPTCRTLAIHCEGLDRRIDIAVDETQIQQVMTNLLLNAAHACGPRGQVWCRLAQLPRSARIEVEDDGVGIKPDLLDKVFEPFFTTKARGTGLGLAICKRIVETHGGSIRLDSTPGKGTRISIELPGET